MKTQADIAESQKAVDRLEELVKRGENAKISVVRKVYSGCVVTIDQQTLTVKKELQESVCFQKKKRRGCDDLSQVNRCSFCNISEK